MRLVSVLLIWIVLTWFLSWFGNWILGFAGAFLIVPVFRIPLRSSFTLGFCAGFISWLATAWFLDQANHSQLSGMISALLHIKSNMIILGITGILGGFGVALAAWVAVRVFPPPGAVKVVA